MKADEIIHLISPVRSDYIFQLLTNWKDLLHQDPVNPLQ